LSCVGELNCEGKEGDEGRLKRPQLTAREGRQAEVAEGAKEVVTGVYQSA
jgi:hypothetical protein